jgi:hypothetical protein
VSIESTGPKHSPLLIGTGVFALLWVVARACVQSITIDEADTYLTYVARPGLSSWDPGSNNHVLNSLLMRLFTSIFGASVFTLRLPALLGAAWYIVAVYCLVRLISRRRLLAWALFVCLTFSPFVMDYLVAARGYSLASAFLMSMLALAGWRQAQDAAARAASLWRTCVLISIAAALSVCANFSFAVAVSLTALGLCLWICREHRRQYFQILAAFTLPGLAVAFFFVGSVLLAWPKGQFTWGATSLGTTIHSLVSASLFEPNPYLLNPRLHHQFVHFGRFLYPLLAAFVLWRLAALVFGRAALRDPGARGLAALAALSGGAVTLALACHQLLYSAFGILLPLDRTAMYVVLLFLAMAGALAGIPLPSAMGRFSGKALTAILTLIACYNIGCLRLSYFNEWKYDADMKNVYAVLSYYNHSYGMTKVSVNWRYEGALNCYRALSGRETIEHIPGAPSVVNYYPPGFQAYVFYYPWDEGFYKREGLKLVYHDKFTEAAVAIRPEVESVEPRAAP